MATKWKRSKKTSGPKLRKRRATALERLEQQLKKQALTDSQKQRIQKEIETLKERI